ncbi:hypothetical protein SAMN05216354_0359 [Xylanibacter ruminicola]|uniref:Uncharacterized protein n=1 Tax=Xylanibacter ruminicola TaxID=839 RepID=A0A1H5RVF9_XYLRU|nr:hypothetical protein [Xylanibacter ruminicola]SEF42333.1 hypothetical protein SAMN05216354_0359 [Xylanibacter ruminicola]
MDDISYKEVDLWVREELSQHGEWLIDRFVEALEKGGNVVSGDLLDSFDYQTGSEGGAQTLTVSFLTYGRLAEVMSSRRKKQQKIAKKNGDVWGRKNHSPKKVKWYNKNRYAGYGRLIRRLTAGMSDHELQRIRGIIEKQKVKLAANS